MVSEISLISFVHFISFQGFTHWQVSHQLPEWQSPNQCCISGVQGRIIRQRRQQRWRRQ